ncbi:MAG: hypothetical protein M3O22_06470 [Pseudomonadota bacterium]|nr:hypothetical protein [Pseudomonadota bacterium]
MMMAESEKIPLSEEAHAVLASLGLLEDDVVEYRTDGVTHRIHARALLDYDRFFSEKTRADDSEQDGREPRTLGAGFDIKWTDQGVTGIDAAIRSELLDRVLPIDMLLFLIAGDDKKKLSQDPEKEFRRQVLIHPKNSFRESCYRGFMPWDCHLDVTIDPTGKSRDFLTVRGGES